MMFDDFGFEQLFAMGPETVEGARLVIFHKTTIADNIGCQDRGKLSFHGYPSLWGRFRAYPPPDNRATRSESAESAHSLDDSGLDQVYLARIRMSGCLCFRVALAHPIQCTVSHLGILASNGFKRKEPCADSTHLAEETGLRRKDDGGGLTHSISIKKKYCCRSYTPRPVRNGTPTEGRWGVELTSKLLKDVDI